MSGPHRLKPGWLARDLAAAQERFRADPRLQALWRGMHGLDRRCFHCGQPLPNDPEVEAQFQRLALPNQTDSNGERG